MGVGQTDAQQSSFPQLIGQPRQLNDIVDATMRQPAGVGAQMGNTHAPVQLGSSVVATDAGVNLGDAVVGFVLVVVKTVVVAGHTTVPQLFGQLHESNIIVEGSL